LPAPHLSHVFPYFVPERCPAWTLNWPFHRLQALSNSLPSRFTKGNLVVETCKYNQCLLVVIHKACTDDAAYRPVEIASEHIDSEESATPNRVSPTGTSLSPIHHDYVCDTQSLEVASIHLGTSYPNLRICKLHVSGNLRASQTYLQILRSIPSYPYIHHLLLIWIWGKSHPSYSNSLATRNWVLNIPISICVGVLFAGEGIES
jgi:hypothetical protein